MNTLKNILLFTLIGFVMPLFGMKRIFRHRLPIVAVKAPPGQAQKNLRSCLAHFENQLETVENPFDLIDELKPFVEELISYEANIKNEQDFFDVYNKIEDLLPKIIFKNDPQFINLLYRSVYNCYQSIISDVKKPPNQGAVDVKGRIFEVLALLTVYQDPNKFGKILDIGNPCGNISEIDITTEKYIIEVKAAYRVDENILNQMEAHSLFINRGLDSNSKKYLIFCAQNKTRQNYIHLLQKISNFSAYPNLKKLKTIYFYIYGAKINSFTFSKSSLGNKINLGAFFPEKIYEKHDAPGT